MAVKLLRGILTLLIVTVYVGATMLRFAPSYASNADMNHAALGGMMQDRDEPSDKTPCKGSLPGCVTDLGCIFLMSLAAPDLTLVTVTVWSLPYAPMGGARARAVPGRRAATIMVAVAEKVIPA